MKHLLALVEFLLFALWLAGDVVALWSRRLFQPRKK